MNTMERAKIASIVPSHKEKIPLGTSALKITYGTAVSLSTRNITIYQIDKVGEDIRHVRMRQATPGISEFCSVKEHNTIVTVNVLPSTFSIPNSEYRVYVGPNFVNYNETNEPINRLPNTNW